MPHEAATHDDPRELLERAERIAEATHEEIAFALGRLLVWQLDGKTRSGMGDRLLVTAYKIRPDLIGGITLAKIASYGASGKNAKKTRQAICNLARKFSRTFGIKGINDKQGALASARYRDAWHKRHPNAKRPNGKKTTWKTPAYHLWLVNAFEEWRATLEAADALPSTPEARERMIQELQPIARFLEQLQ